MNQIEDASITTRQKKIRVCKIYPAIGPTTMEKLFVYIRSKNGEFISPFLLSKFIDINIGKIDSAKHTKEGLLVKLTKNQAESIKGAKIGSIELDVTQNEHLNTSKGVIFFPAFKFLSDEEILEDLKQQHVFKITRFLKRGDVNALEKGTKEGRINTGLFLLHFNIPTKPQCIIICHERVEVRTFYQNPLKCMNCHKFGHKGLNCRSNKICGNCSEAYHDICDNQPKCINCNNAHSSWSKTCPRFIHEQAIIKYATDNQVPFKDARQRQQTNVKSQSFAETLKRDEEMEVLKKQLSILQETNMKLMKMIEDLNPTTAISTPSIQPSTTITRLRSAMNQPKLTTPHNIKPTQNNSKEKKKSYEDQFQELVLEESVDNSSASETDGKMNTPPSPSFKKSKNSKRSKQ